MSARTGGALPPGSMKSTSGSWPLARGPLPAPKSSCTSVSENGAPAPLPLNRIVTTTN